MNDRNGDSLMERFLSGAMSSSEEGAFLARYGGDPEVRSRIDAERTMRRGIETEKDVLPMPPAGSRDRFIAMLANAPATGTALPEQGSGWLRRTLAVIAVLGFIATLTALLMRSTPSDRATRSVPAPATQQPATHPDTLRERTLADTPARTRIVVPATKGTAAGTTGSHGGTATSGRSEGDTTVATMPRATRDSAAITPDAGTMQTSGREKARLPVMIQDPTITTKKPEH